MNLPQPFDFFATHIDPQKFLDCLESRQVADLWVDGMLFSSPKNMTDDELSESFVNDVLSVTMWELQTGMALNFDKAEMLRHVSEDQHDRIWDMINHQQVVGLIQFNGSQLRIRTQKEILQAAMDYSGAYYGGFEMPGGILVVNNTIRGSIQDEEELDAFCNELFARFPRLANMMH